MHTMPFKFRHLHKIVGGFFILSCLALFILTAVVARGEKWFQKYARYTTHFSAAQGLSSGASVMLKGLQIGLVDRVTLDADNRVKVEFRIFEQYADRVRQGTEASILSSFLGSSQLELSLGPQNHELIAEKSEIPASAQTGGKLDELLETFGNIAKRLEDPQGDLMQILQNMKGITANLDKAMAPTDGSLYSELLSSMGHLDKVLNGLETSTPDMRDAIGEARKGLWEANKVIKALQKNFLLRGNVEQLYEEDSSLRSEGR